MHPATLVVSGSTGYSRDYRAYPYGTYDQPGHAELFFPIPDGIDTRRPPKERVLGLPIPGGGTAFLFGELLEAGPVAAVSGFYAGVPIVVFWDSSVASVPHSSFGRSVVIRPL